MLLLLLDVEASPAGFCQWPPNPEPLPLASDSHSKAAAQLPLRHTRSAAHLSVNQKLTSSFC